MILRRRRGWAQLLLAGFMGWMVAGCGGYPQILNFPLGRGGKGLNSLAAEVSPHLNPPYLVFVSDRNGYQGIYLFNIQNRSLVALPGLNALDEVVSQPSVSEDGRYIAFSLSSRGQTDIYLYDRQTQQKRNLTASLSAPTRNPSLSADGDRLAFEIARQGQWDLQVMDRQGNLIDP